MKISSDYSPNQTELYLNNEELYVLIRALEEFGRRAEFRDGRVNDLMTQFLDYFKECEEDRNSSAD